MGPNGRTMTRYVIAVYPETEGSHPYTPSVDVLGLPDEWTDLHLRKNEDGTITAVPMHVADELFTVPGKCYHLASDQCFRTDHDRSPYLWVDTDNPWVDTDNPWVDAPGEPA